MEATIQSLSGTVQVALPSAPDQWRDARVGDKLPAGTRIQTGLRSKVIMTFGEATVVSIDRVTLASIDQFHRSGDTKVVRMGLGHGMVRATAVETTLRSDMTIASPTATLSKRGTDDFGMRYDSGTGQFKIFLNQDGLVEALDHWTNKRRTIRTGEYVTQAMLRWVETALLDRHVQVVSFFGPTGSELNFNARNPTGIGSVQPGAGFQNYALAGRNGIGTIPGQPFGNLIGQAGVGAFTLTVLPAILQPEGGPFNRPEGNFGTGIGVLQAARHR